MLKYPNSLDLNKIFEQSNNSYLLKSLLENIFKQSDNSDLLKSLLENIINKQKDFENQLKDINTKLKKVTGGEASGGTKAVIDDGISLEESPELDVITNNMIKKLKSHERYINDIYSGSMGKSVQDGEGKDSEKVLIPDKQMRDLVKTFEELKNDAEQHDKKLEELKQKIQDLKIIEILKPNTDADGGDSSLTLGLINNLEKKVFTKLSFIDERIKKLEVSNYKVVRDVQNKNNNSDLNKRNIDKLFKQMNENLEKINELEDKFNADLNNINKANEDNNDVEKKIDNKDARKKTTAKDEDVKPATDPKIKENPKKISEAERPTKPVPKDHEKPK